MRKVTMVRLGIAAAISTIGALGALAAGCTSDDSTGNPINNTDGGNNPDTGSPVGDDDGGNPADTGVTPPKPDAGPAPVDAKLIIVHAAPGLGPVRLCFATSNAGGTPSVTAISALPDTKGSAPPYAAPPAYGAYYDGGSSPVAQGTPGIYPGTIGAFPDITSLATLTITPYLIDANLIANNTAAAGPDGGAELDCQHLIGQHGLGTGEATGAVKGILDPSQFIKLAQVPSGTLLDNQTFLLSLTGCSGSYQLSAEAQGLNDAIVKAGGTAPITLESICGPSFADAGAAGNVSVGVAPIDTATAVADGGIGIQFAYRSTMIENALVPSAAGSFHPPASGGIVPGIVTETPFITVNDGGVDEAGAPIDAGTTPGLAPNFQLLGTPVKTTNAQITPVVSVPAGPTQYAFGGLTLPGSLPDGGVAFSPWPASAAGQGDLIAVPLTAVAQLSAWQSSLAPDSGAPTTFAAGTKFTFVLLGSAYDPGLANPDGGASPNPAYNGLGIHAVAFPNVFTPTKSN